MFFIIYRPLSRKSKKLINTFGRSPGSRLVVYLPIPLEIVVMKCNNKHSLMELSLQLREQLRLLERRSVEIKLEVLYFLSYLPTLLSPDSLLIGTKKFPSPNQIFTAKLNI